MAEIIKTYKGKEYTILVDDEDICKLENCQLRLDHYPKNKEKLRIKIKSKTLKEKILARVLLNVEDKKIQVDHINNNSLDNRKCNLRACTQTENARNRDKQKNNKSGYKGVSVHGDRYRVKIHPNGKTIELGIYDDKKEAAKAYNAAAIKYFGEFAFLNKLD